MNFMHWAPGIPRAEGWLHDARLMSDPYRYLSVLMARQGCNALQLRLMGEPTLCMAGAEAVAFFYDSEQIQRQGAAAGNALWQGRCAGHAAPRRCSSSKRDAAIQLMLLALEVLLVQMRYEAAPRRPPLDYARLPALPENGMRIAWLRTVSAFRAVPPWR